MAEYAYAGHNAFQPRRQNAHRLKAKAEQTTWDLATTRFRAL